VPDLDHSIGDRIACCDVDDLGVEDELYTFFIFDDILANIFSGDVIWILCDIWTEDT
jgi:hypothetical protein